MGHITGSQDADLHDGDGEHVSTARSAGGSAVARHEKRIRDHLDGHEHLAGSDSLVERILRRPLRVKGKPVPKDVVDGPVGQFARFCGETDPAVLAILDRMDGDDSE